jgi:hypothetical protein
MHVYIRMHVYMYVGIRICMYVHTPCVHTCIHTCIRIYIHTYKLCVWQMSDHSALTQAMPRSLAPLRVNTSSVPTYSGRMAHIPACGMNEQQQVEMCPAPAALAVDPSSGLLISESPPSPRNELQDVRNYTPASIRAFYVYMMDA